MREEQPAKAKPKSRRSKKPPADRLANALRDNLKRRKAQARAKAAEPEKPNKDPE